MRTTILALAAPALISAAPPEKEVETIRSNPAPTAFAAAEDEGETICKDRIHEARTANSQPMLQRETARSEEGLLIAAVDQRINGCSVMVMYNDTSDIRPIPKPADNVELIPAD